MAPILKELEAPVATTSPSGPAAPPSKPSSEAPARPQPVALEIPVTVNGARTVDGSDKREPFSETTQTVLVFPLGAVIRTVTPLVPGQLVFLTNEKTKKEVVCQVVKSKSSSAAGGYVELQFTEPSAGFWGLQIPSPSSAPAAPKAVVPPAPAAVKPVVAKPIAPAASPMPPPRPVVVPLPPPVVRQEPSASHPEPVVPVIPAPEITPAPPVPVAAVPAVGPDAEPVISLPSIDAAPQVSVIPELVVAAPEPPALVAAPGQVAHTPATPVPPLRDYSKQIDALFAVPQAPAPPAVPEPAPAAVPAEPSAEELKLQTARLQAQLSSLHFTETPSASQVPSALSFTPKPGAPVAGGTRKILEIAQEDPKPFVRSEPKPASPARKSTAVPLAADEEVRIPSWLAPLSQNSESTLGQAPDSGEASLDRTVSVHSKESDDSLVADAPRRPQTAVFGGQLLGESSAQAGEASSTGSRRGIFLGLAAAVGLLIGGGWYYLHNLAGSPTFAAGHPASYASSAASGHSSDLPTAPGVAASGSNNVNSSPAISSQPSKNSASAQIPAVSVSAPQPRNSNAAPKNDEEAPKKPSLGDVRLATPVVNRGADSQQEGDAVPTIEANAAPTGEDPLSASSHRPQPAVPLPVGGDVTPAQLIKSVPPEYPSMAKAQHISGSVQIDAFIDASGNVQSVKILSGPTLLHHAALDAVKQWKYSPALLDGQPTSMHLTVTVQFRNQ